MVKNTDGHICAPYIYMNSSMERNMYLMQKYRYRAFDTSVSLLREMPLQLDNKNNSDYTLLIISQISFKKLQIGRQVCYIKLYVLIRYRQTSHISRTLLGNWSLNAYRRSSNYIFILNLISGFIELYQDACKTRRQTFKFWDLMCLILEIWRLLVKWGYIRLYIYDW